MGTSWLAEERAAAAHRAYCDEIAKERLAAAWSKLRDDHEHLQDLLLRVRDELHHKHGPDDGDTCYACFLEGEIDKAVGTERTDGD